MVKLNVHTEDSKGYVPPSLFRAARNNDIIELAAALQDGQSLDEVQDRQTGLTPIHVACIHHSVDFLLAATQHKFDPWIRDANLRTAMDHARAQNLREVQKSLLEKMYPSGWAESPIIGFP